MRYEFRMTIEIFTQLTANGDQLEQQYKLRKRFCIDYLNWPDRTVFAGMEYDQYDHPGSVYIVWRDHENIARAMVRFTPCSVPYMIKDHWPELIAECDAPSQYDQWELTRFCVERELGKDISLAIGEICAAAEKLAHYVGIKEYWWIAPKERLAAILPHNNHIVGPGKQIGDEFCYAGYSIAKEMVNPEVKWRLDALEDLEIPELAA